MPINSTTRPLSAPELLSRTLGGRYELLELLGEGIVFATFRAHDKQQKREVAVKIVLPQHAGNADLLSALRSGVGDVMALSHIGIARTSDVGEEPEFGIGFFLAEELVPGIDLKERLRGDSLLSHSVAVEVLLSLANALQYAADRNIRHGDVRPSHVLTGAQTPIKLTGWGVSEAQNLAAGEDPALFLPSAPYTAPEVWASGVPTASGDLYALGVILYEMLTGRLPFSADGNALSIARRHADEPVPSPRALQISVPRALDGVTQKLLAKRPADRYRTAAHLVTDLIAIRDALRHGHSLAWSPLDDPTIPVPTTTAGHAESATTVMPLATGAKRSSSKWPLAGGTQEESMRVSEAVVPIDPGASQTAMSQRPPATDFIVPEEDEHMSAAIPAHKRKGASFSWLLPLNLLLATIFIATCGYVINLMFLALEPPTDVIVPNLVGKSLTEAKSLGAARKFQVEIVNEQFNDKYPEDTIYQMRPEAGRHIRENKKVTVWVSRGPRMVTVPDVFDVSFDKARQVLEKEGLRVGEKKYEWDVMTAKGNIVQQVPSEGENRPRGTRVDLVISKGPEPVEPQGPVPGIVPELDPPVEEAVPLEDEKESSLTLQYDVPNDGKEHVVRIDVTDSRGTRTIVPPQAYAAGEKVPLDVTGYGSKITFRVYDNDILQQKITGPPWSSSGEKTP